MAVDGLAAILAFFGVDPKKLSVFAPPLRRLPDHLAPRPRPNGTNFVLMKKGPF
jgi:hypothetical protein